MEEKKILSSLKSFGSNIAIATLIAYVTTTLMQAGYFMQYGVDISIVSLRLDPVTMLPVGIIAFFGLYIWGILRVKIYLEKTDSLIVLIFADLFLLIMYIIGISVQFLSSEVKENLPFINIFTILIYAFTVFYIIRIALTLYSLYKRKLTLKDIYKKYTLFSRPQMKTKFGKKFQNKSNLVLYVVCSIFLIFIFPITIGAGFAQTKVIYPIFLDVTSSNSTDKDKVEVIIGKLNDGYLLKTYSYKDKRFSPGWSLKLADSISFRMDRIVPISKQADL